MTRAAVTRGLDDLDAESLHLPARLALTREVALAASFLGEDELTTTLARLADQLGSITDSYNTNSHACLSVISFMDALLVPLWPDNPPPMDTGRRAVLSAPLDDAVRRVHADELCQRGDPRGELIQVQQELARLDPDDARAPPLRAREAELLLAHRGAWLAHLDDLGERTGWTFSRGCVSGARMSAAELAVRGEELFAVEPIETVELLPCTPAAGAEAFRALIERPWPASLRWVSAPVPSVDDLPALQHAAAAKELELVARGGVLFLTAR